MKNTAIQIMIGFNEKIMVKECFRKLGNEEIGERMNDFVLDMLRRKLGYTFDGECVKVVDPQQIPRVEIDLEQVNISIETQWWCIRIDSMEKKYLQSIVRKHTPAYLKEGDKIRFVNNDLAPFLKRQVRECFYYILDDNKNVVRTKDE